jgi:hypothetical protein
MKALPICEWSFISFIHHLLEVASLTLSPCFQDYCPVLIPLSYGKLTGASDLLLLPQPSL